MARRRTKAVLTAGPGGFRRGGRPTKAPQGISVRRDSLGRTFFLDREGRRISAATAERSARAILGARNARAPRRATDALTTLRKLAGPRLTVSRRGVGYVVRPRRYRGDFEGVVHEFDAFAERARKRGLNMLAAPGAEIDVTPPDGTKVPAYTIDRRRGFTLRGLDHVPGPGMRLMSGLRGILKAVGEKEYVADVDAPELSLYFNRRLPPAARRKRERTKAHAKERARPTKKRPSRR